jgi:hypothetical protein
MPGPGFAPLQFMYWTDPVSGLTNGVDFDVVLSETHENELTLTSHPVETGAAMTDHATEEPDLLTLECFMGDVANPRTDDDVSQQLVDVSVPGFSDPGTEQITLNIPRPPLSFSPTLLVRAGIGALVDAIAGAPQGTFRGKARAATQAFSVVLAQQTAPRDRVRDVYETLLDAQQKRALITVQARLREHSDMILTRLPAAQNDDTGNGAQFDIELKRIRVADTETVRAPQPAEKRGQTSKSGGSQHAGADPKAPAKEAVFQSTLLQITNRVGEVANALLTQTDIPE